MRPTSIIATAAYLSLLLGAIPSSVQGQLNWETKKLSLTPAPHEEAVEGVFNFKNTGDKKVRITKVDPTCGCTVTELEKKTYAPGEKGRLKAEVSFRRGNVYLHKYVYVTSKYDEESEVTKLLLRIDAREYVDVNPEYVHWRKGDKAEAEVVKVEVKKMPRSISRTSR